MSSGRDDLAAPAAVEGGADRCGWRVLGDVTVEIGDTSGSLAGQRQRAVLAYLVLHPNTNVGVDELIDALWADEPPMTARNSIQRFIADIRRRLGPGAHRLQTGGGGYLLEVRDDESDIDRARSLLDRGRDRMLAGDAPAASTMFRAGLTEFRGQPLGGIGEVGFASAATNELIELQRSLQEGGFEAGLALGRHGRLMEDLHRFAHDNPHRESAWALLILALYRAGRQFDALEAAKHLRDTLVEDLGVDPSPIIVELIHGILNHSPRLRLESPSEAPDATEPAWRPPLPSRLARALTGPIVGRDTELNAATAAVEHLAQEASHVTFLTGEPGIGKTRLAAEFAQLADRHGALVYYGRSDEDAAVPLGAWAEVLSDVIAANSDRAEVLNIGQLINDLGALLPELGIAPSGAIVADPEVRRASLFRTVTQLLNGIAQHHPIVVVLDDLQWAEASTTQLLRHVARHARGPMWIIGAYRDTEVDPEHHLADVVASLQLEPHVDLHHLGGLDDDETARLIESLLPESDAAAVPSFARAVRVETSGNPFFASEIVRDLIESLPENASTTAPAEGFGFDAVSLPESVRQVVRQRVARLGADATRTLSAASVLGRTFDLAVTAEMLETETERVLDHVEAAIDASLVFEVPDQVDRFSFEHDLVHHSLYLDVSKSRRRRLHAAAGRAIRDRTPDTMNAERSGEVAGHLIEAADPRIATETVSAIREAARVAAHRHVPDEAAILLASALDLLDDDAFAAAIDADESTEQLRIELLVERGTQLRNAGRPEYRDALLDAGRAAEVAGDVDAMVEAALANTRGLQTNVWEVDHARVRQLEVAAAALGSERTARRANLLGSLASEKWQDDRRAESAVIRAESIALARQVDDDETLANVLARAGRARNTITPVSELRRMSDEMRILARRGDDFDPYLMINLLRTIQNQALRDADPALLDEMSNAIRDYATAHPLPACERAAILTEVLLAGIHGDGTEYLRLADRAFEVSVEMGDPETMIAYEGHVFYGLHLLGRTSEVLDQAVDVAEARPQLDLYQAIAANAMHLNGLDDDARRIVKTALATGFGHGIDDYTIQSLQLWADVAAGIGQLEACTDLYGLLSPHSGRLSGHVVHVTQPVDLSLGRLCHALGRIDGALAHLDMSEQIASSFAGTWMIEQTRLSRARVLIDRDDRGDHETSAELLRSVVEDARRHRHPHLVDDALELLGRLD